MGIFNFDFLQDTELGADAPRRKNVFLYLEILFRKFFKLMRSNMLYFLISLPVFLLVYAFLPVEYFLANILPQNVFREVSSAIPQTRLMLAALFAVFFGSGPASAGYGYILRCFTRENHVWVWSDFWEKFRENLKQGLIVLLVSLISVPLILTAFFVYFKLSLSSPSGMYSVLLYFLAVLLIMVMLMHGFIYQIMITYNCTVNMLYKNAFLLVLAKFPITLINSCIAAAIVVLMFTWLNPIFACILFILFGYGLARFPLEFYAARTIERMISASEPEEDGDKEEDLQYE